MIRFIYKNVLVELHGLYESWERLLPDLGDWILFPHWHITMDDDVVEIHISE